MLPILKGVDPAALKPCLHPVPQVGQRLRVEGGDFAIGSKQINMGNI